MTNEAIRVEGLVETQRVLRDIDRTLPRHLRRVFNEAGELVVRQAKPKLPVQTGRLAASLRTQSTQREGRVKLGTPARVPYAGWVEFGGTIHHRGQHPHKGAHRIGRPFIKGGRYLFPAFDQVRPQVHTAAADGIEALLRQVGLIP